MMGKKNDTRIGTLLGKDTQINGDFTSEGSVRIDGKIEGNVSVTGMLIIGAAGSVSGDICATSVMVGGEVLGNLTVTDKTELTATAKVLGDIKTSVIVIDEHAVFQGKCDMNQETPDRKARPRRASAVRAGKKSAKAALAEALKEVQEESSEQLTEETSAAVSGNDASAAEK